MASQTSSFQTFYLNSALPGHFFLQPSIKVGALYGRIFSPLQQTGGKGVQEVIKRIALFIILPLGAILSGLLIPFGLLTKGLYVACCAPPPTAIPLPQSESQPPIPHRPMPADLPPMAPPKQPPRFRYDFSARSPAEPILKPVRQALEIVNRRSIEPATLDEIRRRFEVPEIEALRGETPSDDPLFSRDRDELEKLELWIEALQFHYDFYGNAVQPNGWMGEGEEAVSDNGNCLFEAAVLLSQVNDSDVLTAQIERERTVNWMEENYQDDENLQAFLVHSMVEHFLAKVERLEADRQGLQEILEAQQRIPQIQQEIETIETTIIFPLLCASRAEGEAIDFEHAIPLLSAYFEEMHQSGTHAGQAELYAISCRHEVCIKIHPKDPQAQTIDREPYIVINPDAESDERPARHFTHTRNHYNPYFPD